MFKTEREKAVYAIAKACDRREPVSDPMFDHAETVLGCEGLAELIAFLGYYSGIAITMKLYSPAP